MAPTIRWRIPPDISWGYCVTRVSADGIRTDFSRSRARAQALAFPTPSCTRSPPDLVPMVNSGLSEAIGSCKDHPDALAPHLPHLGLGLLDQVFALEEDLAPHVRAAVGSSRRMESASVLLPEPDSPTIPSVSTRVDRQREVVHRPDHRRPRAET